MGKPKQQSTRPSILCVTQKRAFMPLYIVLGQQRACMPVYIGKSGDLVRCYRCLTDTQTTEYRATQLLYSIQFKLSHAMSKVSTLTPRFATSMCDPYTSTHTIITVTVKKCHHSPPYLPPLCMTHIPALTPLQSPHTPQPPSSTTTTPSPC